MWPWTHLAVGYLVVSIAWRLRGRRVDGAVAGAAVLGTQFPDLVDKPLAWYVGVLPAGRSLTHSAITAAAISAVVVTVAARLDRFEPGLAFAVAYASHLLGDALPKLPDGDYESLTFLLWPLLPLPDYGGAEQPLESLGEILAMPGAYVFASPARLAVLGIVALVWRADGCPGLAEIGRCLSRARRAVGH